jgi:hypothetical protein
MTKKGASFIEKYSKRPQSMEDVSLWEAARLYTPKLRGPWCQKRKPAVVSVFPKYRPSTRTDDNERYYKQQVLLHIPWREEIDAKGDFLLYRLVS